jgi:hypothetical protein
MWEKLQTPLMVLGIGVIMTFVADNMRESANPSKMLLYLIGLGFMIVGGCGACGVIDPMLSSGVGG